MVLDPVILNQNKNQVSFTGSKTYVSHKLLTPSRNLYQVELSCLYTKFHNVRSLCLVQFASDGIFGRSSSAVPLQVITFAPVD